MQEQEDDDQEALALELERALEEEAEVGSISGDEGSIDRKADAAQGASDGGGGKRSAQGKLAAGEEDGPPCGDGKAITNNAHHLAASLPDEVLIRIVRCIGTGPTQLGRVCRRWERARVQVMRDRHVATLAKRVEGLPERMARDIEAALFESTGRRVACPEYKAVLRRLLFNLKAQGSNPSLRAQVLSGELPPFRLVRLSPEEWLSEEARALVDEAGKAAHKRISLSEEEAQAQAGRTLSRAYQCSRCRQNRCWVRRWRRKPQVDRYRLLISCANCGLEWDE